ncbi:MAG: hypothetical protein ACRCX2_09520 [Paraclostridium sp.]
MKFKKSIAALLGVLVLGSSMVTSFADTKVDISEAKTGVYSVEQENQSDVRAWNLHWKVRGTGVRMRRTPSTSGEIMLVLPTNASVFSENTTGSLTNGFRNVRYESGGKYYYGWVSASYLEEMWGGF